jgi:hypothetical protein
MVYSKYGPLLERLRYVASHPPELPIPWATRNGTGSYNSASVPTEGTYSRSPLYRAERKAVATLSTPWILYSSQDVENYSRAVLKRALPFFSRADWLVSFSYGPEGVATYLGGTVTIPLPVRQTTLLHELAHHLSGPASEHGPDFVQAYTHLLSQEMGPDFAKKLVDILQQ